MSLLKNTEEFCALFSSFRECGIEPLLATTVCNYIYTFDGENNRLRFGLKHGVWKKEIVNKTITEVATYKDGVLNGPLKLFKNKNNILLCEMEYKNGIMVGTRKQYNQGRLWKISNFNEKGELHGTTYEVSFVEDVKTVDGSRDGFITIDDRQYIVLQEIKHNQGYMEKLITRDKNGNLLKIRHFQQGELHGQTIDYFTNDSKIKRIIPYKNNLVHGEFIEYFEDGSVKSKIEYENGVVVIPDDLKSRHELRSQGSFASEDQLAPVPKAREQSSQARL